MSSLKESELSDLASTTVGTNVAARFPEGTRRRIWVSPEISSHAAIILTTKTIYLVSGTNTPSSDLIGLIKEGTDPVDVFGPMVIAINLGSVRLVAHDLLKNCIHLETLAGSGETGTWSSRTSIVFRQSDAADSLFAKLWRRLGDQYKLRKETPRDTTFSSTSLAVVAGIVIATLVTIMLLNLVADQGRAIPESLSFLGKIQWRWVAVTGGIAAALAQVWFYRRATQPPVRLELVRDAV